MGEWVDMKITALRGDITTVDVDAIMIPATPRRLEQRRIEDQLAERAGIEIQAETAARGPIDVGEVMMTTGGRLRCRYVIHAPISTDERIVDPEGVKKSTLAALRCAAGSGFRSLAIPAFPRGESATRAFVSAIRDFDRGSSLEEILIVAQSGEIVSALKKEISASN